MNFLSSNNFSFELDSLKMMFGINIIRKDKVEYDPNLVQKSSGLKRKYYDFSEANHSFSLDHLFNKDPDVDEEGPVTESLKTFGSCFEPIDKILISREELEEGKSTNPYKDFGRSEFLDNKNPQPSKLFLENKVDMQNHLENTEYFIFERQKSLPKIIYQAKNHSKMAVVNLEAENCRYYTDDEDKDVLILRSAQGSLKKIGFPLINEGNSNFYQSVSNKIKLPGPIYLNPDENYVNSYQNTTMASSIMYRGNESLQKNASYQKRIPLQALTEGSSSYKHIRKSNRPQYYAYV